MKHPIKIYNGKAANRKYRVFQIMNAAFQKARQEIMAQEDAAIFAALDAAVFAIDKKDK
jgi:lysophospholipase L1-like esterase